MKESTYVIPKPNEKIDELVIKRVVERLNKVNSVAQLESYSGSPITDSSSVSLNLMVSEISSFKPLQKEMKYQQKSRTERTDILISYIKKNPELKNHIDQLFIIKQTIFNLNENMSKFKTKVQQREKLLKQNDNVNELDKEIAELNKLVKQDLKKFPEFNNSPTFKDFDNIKGFDKKSYQKYLKYSNDHSFEINSEENKLIDESHSAPESAIRNYLKEKMNKKDYHLELITLPDCRTRDFLNSKITLITKNGGVQASFSSVVKDFIVANNITELKEFLKMVYLNYANTSHKQAYFFIHNLTDDKDIKKYFKEKLTNSDFHEAFPNFHEYKKEYLEEKNKNKQTSAKVENVKCEESHYEHINEEETNEKTEEFVKVLEGPFTKKKPDSDNQ